MPRKKKVEDLPGYEKDTVTNVIINTNSSAFLIEETSFKNLKKKTVKSSK